MRILVLISSLVALVAAPLPATAQIGRYCGDVPRSFFDEEARFTDNGDGTVTDEQTGLMWELKNDDPESIHYYEHEFGWCASSGEGCDIEHGPADGELFTEFLRTLNEHSVDDSGIRNRTDGHAQRPGGFAGYADWRIPNVYELLTLIDRSLCDGEPDDVPCTAIPGEHLSVSWTSSTAIPPGPQFEQVTAYQVGFGRRFAHESAIEKQDALPARAVRGTLGAGSSNNALAMQQLQGAAGNLRDLVCFLGDPRCDCLFGLTDIGSGSEEELAFEAEVRAIVEECHMDDPFRLLSGIGYEAALRVCPE